jgi:hypothetical protein
VTILGREGCEREVRRDGGWEVGVPELEFRDGEDNDEGTVVDALCGNGSKEEEVAVVAVEAAAEGG